MRHVDFDAAAAREAAAACRDAAIEHRGLATQLGADVAGVDWTGPARERFGRQVELLAARLRVEARLLDDTASALERAIVVAHRLEDARAARELARQRAAGEAARRRAAAPCTPTGWHLGHRS